MKCPALVPPKYRLLRLIHPGILSEVRGLRCSSGVAWRRRRLLSTAAAAREVAADGCGRTRKRLSREKRKALVESYVIKYRMMNGGKFPTAADTKKQVGGGYYAVRSILQELEYNSKLPNVEIEDENFIAGQADKVNGKSPLFSKEIVGEAISSSDQSMVDMSSDTKNNDIDSNLIVGQIAEDVDSVGIQIAKVDGISGVSEALDSEVKVGTTSDSTFYGSSANDESSSEGELRNITGHTVFDTSINDMSDKDENLEVGQTSKNNGISEVREGLDDEVLMGKCSVSNDYGSPADNTSSSQGDSGSNSSQSVVDTSIVTNYDEVSVEVETSLKERTAKVNGISKEDSELSSKPYQPLEVPGVSGNSERGKIDEASSKASESDQSTRGKTQNEPQQTSLWGNLKSFASNLISIWRK